MRPGVRDTVQAGQNAAYDEQSELIIYSMRMAPLIDENPDSMPFVDYRRGETQASSGAITGLDFQPPPLIQ